MLQRTNSFEGTPSYSETVTVHTITVLIQIRNVHTEDGYDQNIDFTKIIGDLLGIGFDEEEVTASARDIQRRLQWTVGSNCSIYSRSTKQWTDGTIAKVTVDPKTNGEWLTVQYLTTKKKQMQRLSAFMKPKGG